MKNRRWFLLFINMILLQCNPPKPISIIINPSERTTESQDRLIQAIDNFRNAPISQDLIKDIIRYDVIDAHAITTPREVTTSTDSLAAYLVHSARNDFEKARVIFRWITENIEYDVAAYLSGKLPNCSPDFVLVARKSVCSGYSNLFAELAGRSGLKVIVVDGYAKGTGYQAGQKFSGESNHAWNAVRLENNWYLIDCTWGAGHTKNQNYIRKLNNFYFLTPAAQFVFSHFPQIPKLQLIQAPLSIQEFEQLPNVQSNYFKFETELVTHPQCVIQCQKELCIKIKTRDGIQLAATISREDPYPEGSWILVQKENDTFEINVRFPEIGEYNLAIFARDESSSDSVYPRLMEYLIQVEESSLKAESFPKAYNILNQGKAYLFNPRDGYLQVGNRYQFRLRVLDAKEVSVKTNNSQIKLEKENDQFEGQITIPAGEVIVMARYGVGNQYQYLLKYQTSK